MIPGLTRQVCYSFHVELRKLCDPFPADDIEWRVQSYGQKEAEMWVMVLAYITNRANTDIEAIKGGISSAMKRAAVQWGITEMAYHYLASSSKDSWHPDGEVQIFADYRERVGAAKEAHQALVDNPNEAVICETMQERISRERDHIKAGRKFRNRRRIARGKKFRAERLGLVPSR